MNIENAQVGNERPEMLEREGKYFLWASAQTDAREGVISFLEKRPPQWKLRASVDVPDL